MMLDFPTFERPEKATSGNRFAGSWLMLGKLPINSAELIFMPHHFIFYADQIEKRFFVVKKKSS